MKISFDFDGVLTTTEYQELAKKSLAEGHEIFITTSRDPAADNSSVFKIAAELGIKEENIRCVNYDFKFEHLTDIDVHYDDDELEILFINEEKKRCKGIYTKANVAT